jgi:hypothetical protein
MHERRKVTRGSKAPKTALFGLSHVSPREKDIRFFLLSLLIGLIICVFFGCALFLLNKQGRI